MTTAVVVVNLVPDSLSERSRSHSSVDREPKTQRVTVCSSFALSHV